MSAAASANAPTTDNNVAEKDALAVERKTWEDGWKGSCTLEQGLISLIEAHPYSATTGMPSEALFAAVLTPRQIAEALVTRGKVLTEEGVEESMLKIDPERKQLFKQAMEHNMLKMICCSDGQLKMTAIMAAAYLAL